MAENTPFVITLPRHFTVLTVAKDRTVLLQCDHGFYPFTAVPQRLHAPITSAISCLIFGIPVEPVPLSSPAVVQHRMKAEYGVDTIMEPLAGYKTARWAEGGWEAIDEATVR